MWMLIDTGIFFRVKRLIWKHDLFCGGESLAIIHTMRFCKLKYMFAITVLMSKTRQKYYLKINKYEDRVMRTQDSEFVTENRLVRAPMSSGQTGRRRISRSAYGWIKRPVSAVASLTREKNQLLSEVGIHIG
jgi:hypothetical protein